MSVRDLWARLRRELWLVKRRYQVAWGPMNDDLAHLARTGRLREEER